jgi:hypothetical protein
MVKLWGFAGTGFKKTVKVSPRTFKRSDMIVVINAVPRAVLESFTLVSLKNTFIPNTLALNPSMTKLPGGVFICTKITI